MNFFKAACLIGVVLLAAGCNSPYTSPYTSPENEDTSPAYTITYDANGADSGAVPVDENTYKWGEGISVKGNTGDLQKTGSTFIGWNSGAEGRGTDYAEGATLRALGSSDIRLYAKWLEVSSTASLEIDRLYENPDLAGGHGLAYDGTSLWLFRHNRLYKIDPSNGAVVEVLDVQLPEAVPGTGLTWGAGSLWYSHSHNSEGTEPLTVYEIDPDSGQILSSFPSPAAGDTTSLAWDGDYLWVSGFEEPFYKVETDGSPATSLSPSMDFPLSLCWVDGYLWSAGFSDQEPETLYKIDPATGLAVWSVQTRFNGIGIAYDGTGLWMATDAGLIRFKPDALPLTNHSSYPQWQTVGSPRFSSGEAFENSIAIDNEGTPYVAYSDMGSDATSPGQIAVKAFIDDSWTPVGADFLTDPSYGAHEPSLAIASSNTPYIAYWDENLGDLVSVMKYEESAGAWTPVGGSVAINTEMSYSTSLALDSQDTPYVAYGAHFDQKVYVLKYDGTDWVYVGTPGFSDGTSMYINLAVDSTDTPYVVYIENTGVDFQVTVKKYNGTDWLTVGTPIVGENQFNDAKISFDSQDTPYIAYEDPVHDYQVTVKKYNGSSWETVGTEGFSPYCHANVGLDINSEDVPYVAAFSHGIYGEDESGNLIFGPQKASVAKFDGTEWVFEGSREFTKGNAYFIDFAFDPDDVPYICFSENSTDSTTGFKTTVMKYE